MEKKKFTDEKMLSEWLQAEPQSVNAKHEAFAKEFKEIMAKNGYEEERSVEAERLPARVHFIYTDKPLTALDVDYDASPEEARAEWLQAEPQSMSARHEAFVKEMRELMTKHGYKNTSSVDSDKLPAKVEVLYEDKPMKAMHVDYDASPEEAREDWLKAEPQSKSANHEAFAKEMSDLLKKHGFEHENAVKTDKMPEKVHLVYDEPKHLSSLGIDFKGELEKAHSIWKYSPEDFVEPRYVEFEKDFEELMKRHGYKDVELADKKEMPKSIHVVYADKKHLSALGADFTDQLEGIRSEWEYPTGPSKEEKKDDGKPMSAMHVEYDASPDEAREEWLESEPQSMSSDHEAFYKEFEEIMHRHGYKADKKAHKSFMPKKMELVYGDQPLLALGVDYCDNPSEARDRWLKAEPQSESANHEAFAKELSDLMKKHGYEQGKKADADKLPSKVELIYKDK